MGKRFLRGIGGGAAAVAVLSLGGSFSPGLDIGVAVLGFCIGFAMGPAKPTDAQWGGAAGWRLPEPPDGDRRT